MTLSGPGDFETHAASRHGNEMPPTYSETDPARPTGWNLEVERSPGSSQSSFKCHLRWHSNSSTVINHTEALRSVPVGDIAAVIQGKHLWGNSTVTVNDTVELTSSDLVTLHLSSHPPIHASNSQWDAFKTKFCKSILCVPFCWQGSVLSIHEVDCTKGLLKY
jgi:hypothetical protein